MQERQLSELDQQTRDTDVGQGQNVFTDLGRGGLG